MTLLALPHHPLSFVHYLYVLVCGSQELTEAEGQFTNPGYPGGYQIYDNCMWLIRVKNGSNIELNVYIIELSREEGLEVRTSHK